ncbi:MAG: hypothetical protein KC621_20335 [Myxococcales bacterium]|nr:hypothetical protein [Myxococcales bacterium]
MSWLVLFLAHPASAADVTDMAPGLGALGTLRYAGSSLDGHLVESGEVVAGRKVQRHDLDLGLEFAPAPGVALTLDLALTPSLTFTYADSRTMIVEPEDGSGSYLAGEAVAAPVEIRAGGLTGFWVGAAFAPFSETYAKGQQSSWRIDAALRPPSASRNLWTTVDAKRGTAPGGLGMRVGGAFSVDRGVGNPWVQAVYQSEGRVAVDVVDENGNQWATELAVKPASTLLTRFGVAIEGWEDPDLGAAFAVDLYLGGQYQTWQDVASGVYLPNVLEGGRSIPVTSGDSLAGIAGIALDAAVNEYVQIRAGSEFTYRTPYTLEHVYDVQTSADTWQIGWFFQVQGMGSFKRD